MSTDEPEGYLDDIAETRETEALGNSGGSLGTYKRPTDDPPYLGGSGGAGGVGGSGSAGRRPVADPPAVWRTRTGLTFRFLRTMILTALVLTGLGGIGNILIHHLPRTTHRTYTYSNIQRILVAVDGNGSVDVHGVAGNDVTIEATDKAILLQPVERQIIASGGLLIVSVKCPTSECSSRYDVSVPRTTQVSVTIDRSTDQAGITAADLDSPVDLYTGHGDVALAHLTADVHVVANGDVSGTGLSGNSLDVFAPIAKSVRLQVTGTPQLVRLTTGQPGTVDLTLPAGGYNITCEPKDKCVWPGSVAGAGGTGTITDDSTSPKQVQITVNQSTTANIHS